MTSPPDPQCENCDGVGCMGCRLRLIHDQCEMDCPSCCQPMAAPYDEAWNAVALHSVHYRREQYRMACALRDAQKRGLDVDDLVDATGLDETTVCRLLDGDWA